MATAARSDEALLAALRARPRLRERIASMIGSVLDGDGAPVEAEAAEEPVFDVARLRRRG